MTTENKEVQLEVIEPSLLFVYGTLRKGFYNDRHLATANLIGKGKALGKLWIVQGTFLPILTDQFYSPNINSYNHVIKDVADQYAVGEVYEVPKELWANLDRLESHPKWYCRKLADITMEDKSVIKAWVYYMPVHLQANSGGHEVPSGDYADGIKEEEKRLEANRKSWQETKDRRMKEAQAAEARSNAYSSS